MVTKKLANACCCACIFVFDASNLNKVTVG